MAKKRSQSAQRKPRVDAQRNRDALKEQLVAGVDAELEHQDEQTLVIRRDLALAEILMSR
jgi:hypothetical protein